ncbi:MAG TPA: DUF4034 domain-containing protein [Candidatus Acidoferrum sp.]|nr:DUF4034 domain-containing protein [Candidatus Acidoferrum sp.]
MYWQACASFFLAFGMAMPSVSCGKWPAQEPAAEQISSDALMQVVRSYNPHSKSSQPAVLVSPSKLPTEEAYDVPVKQAFSTGNFDQLEKIVREARESQGRVLGGTWQLAAFYGAIGTTFIGPLSGGADWRLFFDSLNQWIKAKPDSVAARLSLAGAYLDYAWKARGAGPASTVSAQGWMLFGQRTNAAAETLVAAARLKEKCPYWYDLMQQVALAQGWDKAKARELLEQAVAFEPEYYHYYREQANFLQAKWYGEEGEVEAFATEVADRIGGPKGDIDYFEISSLVACQCDAQDDVLQNMSWPRIKRGYAALEKQFGMSQLKRNRFASMAVKAGDKLAARDAIAKIGVVGDQNVWISAARFDRAKNWATSE